MAGKNVEPIRLSAWQFAQHIGKTLNAVTAALKANNVEAGEDKKYSLRDLVRAISGASGLKSKATDARYQEQIDKAQLVADKVAVNRRELVRMKDVEDFVDDLQTIFVQAVRHSKMSQPEKDIAIRQIKERKFGEV